MKPALLAGAAVLLLARIAVADAFADGATLILSQGVLSLQHNGKTLAKKTVDGWRDATLEAVKTASLQQGEGAELTLSSPAGALRAVLWRHGGKLSIPWQGSAALSGDPGERTGEDARLADPDGDGVFHIEKGVLYEGASLCGSDRLPLLFRQIFDPATRKFLPADVFRTLPSAVEVTGTPAPAASTVAIPFALPAAVSSMEGDEGNPLFLSAPSALMDSDGQTRWTPGTGTGRGEFVTFQAISDGWAMTGLEIDVPRKGTDGPAAPRELALLTEDSAFRLVLPDGAPRAAFTLPAPVKTRCFSLVISGVDVQSSPRRTALGEVRVQTEFDGPDGPALLVAALDDPLLGEQAVLLLRAAGMAVVKEIGQRFASLTLAGKRRAARVLADVAPREGAPMLADAAVRGDGFEVADAVRGLGRAGRDGVAALSGFLDDREDAVAMRAMALLSQMGGDGACGALVDRAGTGSSARRARLREALVPCADGSRGDALLQRAADAAQSGAMLTCFDLLDVASRRRSLVDRAAAQAAQMYAAATDFDTRFRALRIVARSREKKATSLVLAAARDPDRYLRETAIIALRRWTDEPAARQALVHALRDGEVAVRMAALIGLAGMEEGDWGDALGFLQEDPWPRVRALVLSASAGLDETRRRPLVARALADDSAIVVGRALDSAAVVGADPAIDVLVAARIDGSEKNPSLRRQAARTAGMRCAKDEKTLKALAWSLAFGADPLADPADAVAAAEAALALGRIGTTAARRMLEQMRERANPTADSAIRSALRQPAGCR